MVVKYRFKMIFYNLFKVLHHAEEESPVLQESPANAATWGKSFLFVRHVINHKAASESLKSNDQCGE